MTKKLGQEIARPFYTGNKRNFRKSAVLSLALITLIFFSFISGCMQIERVANETPSVSSLNTSIRWTDEANDSFSFPHPAEKIVVLPRTTVECLIVIGAGDKIVGVSEDVAKDTRFMSLLPNATNVGSTKSPDIEKITSLKPDIIILASSTPENVKNRLINLNLTVTNFYCYILPNIPSSVRNLGIMTGKTEGAERYLRFYEKYNSTLTERLNNIDEGQMPAVYIELSPNYITAGKGSPNDAQLSKIKANNIAHDLPVQYPIVSWEWVVDRNPDVIIKQKEQSTRKEGNFDTIHEAIVTRPELSGVRAIKNGRVYVISNNILHGPRGIIGQLFLGKIFYPDRFEGINPDSVLNQYADEFFPDSNDIDTVFPDIKIIPPSSFQNNTLLSKAE